MLALTTKPGAAKVPEVPFELPLDKVLAMLLAAEEEVKINWGLDSNQALFTCHCSRNDNCRKDQNRGKSDWYRGKEKKSDRGKVQESCNSGSNDDRCHNCEQVRHYKCGCQQKRQG